MQALKVVRMTALAAATATMTACGDSYVPTAPGLPQDVGLLQPVQPDQPPPPDQPCSKGTSATVRFASPAGVRHGARQGSPAEAPRPVSSVRMNA